MSTNIDGHAATLQRIKEIREQALEHARMAHRLHDERRALMQSLLDDGVSRADIARELGISRQAVQKMMAG